MFYVKCPKCMLKRVLSDIYNETDFQVPQEKPLGKAAIQALQEKHRNVMTGIQNNKIVHILFI